MKIAKGERFATDDLKEMVKRGDIVFEEVPKAELDRRARRMGLKTWPGLGVTEVRLRRPNERPKKGEKK